MMTPKLSHEMLLSSWSKTREWVWEGPPWPYYFDGSASVEEGREDAEDSRGGDGGTVAVP